MIYACNLTHAAHCETQIKTMSLQQDYNTLSTIIMLQRHGLYIWIIFHSYKNYNHTARVYDYSNRNEGWRTFINSDWLKDLHSTDIAVSGRLTLVE